MKIKYLGFFAMLLIAACGKKSNELNINPPITEATPEFKPIPSSQYWIELSTREAFSFPIRMTKSFPTTQFDFSCKGGCPEGFAVSQDGIISWNPKQDAQLKPYFRVDVVAKSAQSLPSTATFEFSITDTIHQIGDKWDKKSLYTLVDSPEAVAIKNVLGTDVTFGTPVGTIEYLGLFENKHLVLSAAHVFEHVKVSGGTNCSKERVFYFTESHLSFSCVKPIFTSTLSDYAIYEVQPIDSSGSIKGSEYPKFSAKTEPLGQPLSIAGYGDYQNPYRDLQFSESESCQTFLEKERKVDYSKVNGFSSKAIPSKFMTILGAPCEASSGDSGGPVILRSSSVIVGIVSAGAQSTFSDAEAIQALNLPEEQRVPYAKLSYVSSLTMYNEISEFIKKPSDEADTLNIWINSQFLK